MTQEQKELLLKDICSRLPYGVKAEILNEEDERKQVVISYGNICYIPELGNWWWKECKPYLFPLSSMTDEQYNEFFTYFHVVEMKEIETSGDYLKAAYLGENAKRDWLNKNHFDYHYLIPKGLANDATGLNIY